MWIVVAIVVVFFLVRASKSRAGADNAVDADAWYVKRAGEPEASPIDVSSALFQTSAMKAREFLDETNVARGSFVDNRQVEEWKDRYAPAFAALQRCNATRSEPDLRRAADVFGDLRGAVDRWNSDFVISESARYDALFGRLDAKQREACVSDEVSTLVVAGAGSGKTSTIQKKVEYLIRAKGVSPKDILLLSFTNKAADEMTERLAQSMPQAGMTASTFHKFGLDIVKALLFEAGSDSLTDVVQLWESYGRLLKENGLEGSKSLSFPNERAFEAWVMRQPGVLYVPTPKSMEMGGRYVRLFEVEKEQLDRLVEYLESGEFQDVDCSAALVFRSESFASLRDELGIRNEYELHAIVRNYCGTINGLVLGRTPTMVFGNGSRRRQLLELIRRLAPISAGDLSKEYEKAYGVDAVVVQGSYLQEVADCKEGGYYAIKLYK